MLPHLQRLSLSLCTSELSPSLQLAFSLCSLLCANRNNSRLSSPPLPCADGDGPPDCVRFRRPHPQSTSQYTSCAAASSSLHLAHRRRDAASDACPRKVTSIPDCRVQIRNGSIRIFKMNLDSFFFEEGDDFFLPFFLLGHIFFVAK